MASKALKGCPTLPSPSPWGPSPTRPPPRIPTWELASHHPSGHPGHLSDACAGKGRGHARTSTQEWPGHHTATVLPSPWATGDPQPAARGHRSGPSSVLKPPGDWREARRPSTKGRLWDGAGRCHTERAFRPPKGAERSRCLRLCSGLETDWFFQ